MHYSFDYAQQIHYPSDPMQPGPMHFSVPRKSVLFDVCCEAILQQVNYLIDEAVVTGKGSNAVISYVHHFFDNWSLGVKSVHINCDNCSGQNKMNGLHHNVELHFLLAGHTKFAPDWCFGLIKQKYRRTLTSSLDDFAKVVKDSLQGWRIFTFNCKSFTQIQNEKIVLIISDSI